MILAGQRLGGAGQLGRAHMLGRRVDQIAGKRDAAYQPLDPAAIGGLGPGEIGKAAPTLLVSGEGVAAERPTQHHRRRQSRGRLGIEAIASFREGIGQPCQHPERLAGLAPHQHARKLAAAIGQQGHLPGFGLEARGFEPTLRRLVERGTELGQPFRSYRRHRNGIAGIVDEMRQHQSSSMPGTAHTVVPSALC